MNNIKHIKTDNIPLIDELVYNLKRLSQSTVLKDEELALKYETLESSRNANIYISCIENRATFDMFQYDETLLKDIGVPINLIDNCMIDKYNIPNQYRDSLVSKSITLYLDNYIETNNYYRSLKGLPDIGDPGIVLSEKYIPIEIRKHIKSGSLLHELNTSQLELLYDYKVIDRFITKYPNKDYLNHLGFRSIPFYNARISNKFALLYTVTDIPKEVLNRYKDKIELNRVYTLKAVYNEAFKLDSDYYDNFIQILIIVQTMMDMFAEVPDMIIKKEIFDIRTIELIFKSNGVDFFPEIPFKYQLAMVRNMNRLIKYKSTTKNIVDICSLFGFDNIKVFKYYILKSRKVNKYGDYEFNTKKIINDNGLEEEVEDLDKNFDLKFIKVPIDDICDNYIHDKTKYIDYDIITEGDKYWDGDLPHNIVKDTILKKEFNYLQSKYLSVDTVYSLTEMSFQLIYFYNMLFDNVVVEDKLKLHIPTLSSSANFKFLDIICYLYALMYEYNGIVDDLMDTTTKILYIKGFNFDVDMRDLAAYVHEKGFTMEQLGVSDFQIAKSSILTFQQLIDIFTKNENIYRHIVDQLYNADNKKIYDIYYKLYDSLMINKLSMEFFRMKNGCIAKSYTEFLHDRDLILYNSLMKIKNMANKDIRQERISDQINSIIYILEDYIDTDKFKYIFSNLPSVSAEAIKKYVYKVINFFKSYKVDILGINTIYKFDDRLENKIKMIDEIIFKYVYTRQETIEMIDRLANQVHLTYDEKVNIIDKVYIEITNWIDKFFDDNMNVKEEIISLTINIIRKEISEIVDQPQNIISKLEQFDIFKYYDKISNSCNLTYKERANIMDKIFIDITEWVSLYSKSDIIVKEVLDKIVTLTHNDNSYITDNKLSKINLLPETKCNITDNLIIT